MAHVHPETVTLKKNNSSATVHLFGATLTSWKPCGVEALFVSQKSYFDSQKPIRGGVPVVFPQFGPWEWGPQHGFARRTKWSVKERTGDIGSDTVTFVLEDSEATRKLWNFKFRFEYALSLVSDNELKMDAIITNTGEKEFDFTFLLHTYFAVSDVKNCAVIGLKGCNYIDKVKNNQNCLEENEKVMISEATDRVYQKTASIITLKPISENREATIEKTNLPDTVVWNPWEESAKKMEDFGDDEWISMICVEAGYVNSHYNLKPKESFKASQLLRVSKL
ncbi:putative glucose-6-phosphate 1-epimerase [Trichonephila clavipes]|uniref:glucose-6-phosphate 1-epimerase n=1 Tax=Trichonephila clavipes TaxID=2585209 RepID=A0A8X6V322_TRICX|nr:putative glucose-6-phosphate 1-epimerase [Trichonephila clavipes]